MNGITQANLFEEVSPSMEIIEGLTYIPNFINAGQEAKLIKTIDRQPWLSDIKRRVQHYGWKYDYTARRVNESMRLGNLPKWLNKLCDKLVCKGYFSKTPDQVIINEYHPGQGIASHIDCVPCFGKTIASISLNSPCVMDFIHSKTYQKASTLLEPRSLLILSGDARYIWKHGIASRKTDKINCQTFWRGRRISMTFRNVVI